MNLDRAASVIQYRYRIRNRDLMISVPDLLSRCVYVSEGIYIIRLELLKPKEWLKFSASYVCFSSHIPGYLYARQNSMITNLDEIELEEDRKYVSELLYGTKRYINCSRRMSNHTKDLRDENPDLINSFKPGSWVMVTSDGDFAGIFTMDLLDKEDDSDIDEYYIGMIIYTKYQGIGFGSKVGRFIMDNLEFDKSLKFLTNCATNNLRSKSLIEKMGFTLIEKSEPKEITCSRFRFSLVVTK